MKYPNIQTQIRRRQAQELQLLGINLTDNYKDGQLLSSKNISSNRYPYITTADQLEIQPTGIPAGFSAISMFAWEKLFVVSNVPRYAIDAEVFVLGRSPGYQDGDYAISDGRIPKDGGFIPAGTLVQFVVESGPGWIVGYWTIVEAEPVGYRCYYGEKYCGDIPTLDLPKQYAVVNSHLVVWPDMIYFNLYDTDMSAHPLITAPHLLTVDSGEITYREKVVTV